MPDINKYNLPATYSRDTLRPWVSLIFILPLLVFYHSAAFYHSSGLLVQSDLSSLMKFFGARGWYLPPVFVSGVLLLWHWVRKDPWKVSPLTFAGMILESLVYVMPLAIIGRFISRLALQATTAAASQPQPPIIQKLMQACGAGIYEEFMFRLVLIGAVLAVAHHVFGAKKNHVAITAVIVSGITFSLYHFLGSENFAWGTFTFRAFAGFYLAMIYVCRGFGISVATHIAWNVCITMRLL